MPIKARVRQHRDGYCVGEVDIAVPGAPGIIRATAKGSTKAQALLRAGAMAERIANDPILSTLIPPQAFTALKVAKGLGLAARGGSHMLRGFLRHLKGPGAHRLAEALHTEAAVGEGYELGDVGSLWSKAKKLAKWSPAGLLVRGGAAAIRRKKRGKRKTVRKPDEEAPETDVDEMHEDEGGGGDDGGGDDEGEE